MTNSNEQSEIISSLLEQLRSILQAAKDAGLEKLNLPLYTQANDQLALLANGQEYRQYDAELVANARRTLSQVGDALEALAGLRRQIVRTLRNDRFVQEMEFDEADARTKAEARANFRRGLTSMAAGDFDEAKRFIDQANAAYLQMVKGSMENGPLQRVRARLDVVREQGKQPKLQIDLLETKLGHLEEVLRRTEADRFDAQFTSDFVLSIVIEIEETLDAGEIFEREPPCPDDVQLEITDITVSASEGGALLQRNSIYYVTGNDIDITFVRPICTMISSVAVQTFPGGYEELGTDPVIYDQTEGATTAPYYYTALAIVPEANRRRRESIRVHFRNLGDGQTLSLQITVSMFSGALSESVELTLVPVSGINEEIEYSISEWELQNGFIVDMYGDYGDDGRADAEDIAFIDVDTIDPQYDEMEMKINFDGVSIRTKFTIDLPILCNPTVTAEGRFHIMPNTATQQFDVVWEDDDPKVDFSFHPLCRIVHPIVEHLHFGVRHYIDGMVKDRIMSRIANRVNTAFAIPIPNFINFVQSVDTYPGEIRIVANAPNFDNVIVEIPYGRLRLNEAFNYGMALNSAESIVVAAGRLAGACTVDGDPNHCEMRQIGPAGLFNWASSVPIPPAWRFSEVAKTWVHFPERRKARQRLRGLRRDPAQLPFPDENPGAVIGRLSTATGQSSAHHFFGDPCVVNTPRFGGSRLAFGNNDYRFLDAKEFGSGSWRITVAWIDASDAQECTSDSSTLELIESTLKAIAADR